MLSNPSAAQDSKGEGTLKYRLHECRPFGHIKNYVPDSVLVGYNEEVPGLADPERGAFLPMGIEDVKIDTEV